MTMRHPGIPPDIRGTYMGLVVSASRDWLPRRRPEILEIAEAVWPTLARAYDAYGHYQRIDIIVLDTVGSPRLILLAIKR